MHKLQPFNEVVKTYLSAFNPVVPFNKNMDKLLLMDFTERNTELKEEILKNTELFSEYINFKLEKANAKYGIGGYNEHRSIYSRSEIFGPHLASPHGRGTAAQPSFKQNTVTNKNISISEVSDWLSSPVGGDDRSGAKLGMGAEPRNIHLGIDIWGEADTPVYAPMQGIVHSFNFNNAFGDYGATIILQHAIEGFYFHTLYGHLSLKSIQNLKQGETVEKGQWIASLGEAEENGHWPPHLHFQIVIDMQGMKGDYPGVCKYSEREAYLANCPDPDLILGMMG